MKTAAPQELKILILDDASTDVELIKRALRRAGHGFTAKWVDTRGAFVDALESFTPDVVLLDYRLPNYDGREALAHVRLVHPEVPVIIVTGTLSDEAAIELLKAGATDYVLKNNLARLASAIDRALDIARMQAARKKAEAEEAVREREVAIGHKIQQMLLLDGIPTDVKGLQVAACSIPSQRVAGDFYLFFTHKDESVDVIVADVMGKGIPAALLGAATKSHFIEALCYLMAYSPSGLLPEPCDIVTLAHARMAQHLIDLESFVTLCYARVNVHRQRVDLVDCGHTGLIHWHERTGQCEVIHGDNLPLGIRKDETYSQIDISFENGDVFLLFSDGVTEASDSAREQFGIDRLLDYVCRNAALGPEPLVAAVRSAVATFTGSDQPSDDLTCVAIEVDDQRRVVARQDTEVRSDLQELRRVREFVRTFCARLPGSWLDENGITELELAVSEAASNIIEHAYHGRADQRILVAAEAFPDHVGIRLHHFGDPFDPSMAAPPAFDGSRESGFGVYLIAHSVDDVRYYYGEQHGGHCIALIKNRKG